LYRISGTTDFDKLWREVQQEATGGSFNLRPHEIKPATWQMKNAVEGRTHAFSSSKVLAGISNWLPVECGIGKQSSRHDGKM
jgi:hypothetical protein